jgi:hypothetical protein
MTDCGKTDNENREGEKSCHRVISIDTANLRDRHN